MTCWLFVRNTFPKNQKKKDNLISALVVLVSLVCFHESIFLHNVKLQLLNLLIPHIMYTLTTFKL